MTIEEIIKEMGYGFRDLTYHSNGKFSCRLGSEFLKGVRGSKEFWGDNPLEALQKAKKALDIFTNPIDIK